MNLSKSVSTVVVLILSIVGIGDIAGAAPRGITYQGQLKDNGKPVNGTVDFRFEVWDSLSGGTAVASVASVTGVSVVNGLFNVELLIDADPAVLYSSGRIWLEIQVANPSGTNFEMLSPRQEITPAPLALYALDAPGGGTGTCNWEKNGADIYYTAGEVGIGTSSPSAPLNVVGEGMWTIYARNTISTGISRGVYGSVSSSYGRGVVGSASSNSGATCGVKGECFSPDGYGVYGINEGESGDAHGVYGRSYSSSGIGVHGYVGVEDMDGPSIGVYGEVESTQGRGVYGKALSTSGANAGVYGSSNSSDGTGVIGVNNAGGYAIHGVASVGGGWAGFFNGKGYFSDFVGIGTADPDYSLHIVAPSGGRGGYATGGRYGFYGSGTDSGLYGVGNNYGVLGTGTTAGVFGTSSAGTGVRGTSSTGVAVSAFSSGTGTSHPALRVTNQNANGIAVFSTCESTDANTVLVNKGSGSIIKGFSGPAGGDLVFQVTNNGRTVTNVLQINGGSDLSEQFDVEAKDTEVEPGMVVCIDPGNPGKLEISNQAYDRKVAGIISGAGGVATGMSMGQSGTIADGDYPVALTGRVYVFVEGQVAPGDLLTTSDIPGVAMRVADYGKAQGAIIGKAMTAQDKGRGLVLVLVTLQ